MQIQSDLLQYYLEGKNIPSRYDELFDNIGGRRKVAQNRQEVCEALSHSLSAYEDGIVWNHTLFEAIFQEDIALLQEIQILPIVGAQAQFDCGMLLLSQKPMLVIDLLNIADYTNILVQMEYILHNLIHKNIVIYLMQKRYPLPVTYQDKLAHRFFVYGFTQFLAWRNGLDDVFSGDAYREKQNRACTLYKRAYQVQDTKTQTQILNMLASCELWDDFSQCSGMFFLSNCYQNEKEIGLREIYTKGPYALSDFLF